MELRKESPVIIETKLHFVTLPKFFRLIGEVPDRILKTGYDPQIGPQIAIFGSGGDLTLWRDSQGLSERDYPTHSSSMGTHIDVYGQSDINQLIDGDLRVGVRDYRRRTEGN